VSRRRRLLLVLAALVFTVVVAIGCDFFLDKAQTSAEGARQLERVFGPGSAVFFISSAVIWVVLVGLVALTGRVLISGALLAAVTVAIGFANYEKLSLRREPLYPSDLAFVSEPGFLREMVDGRTLAIVVAAIVGIVVVVLVASRVLRRVFPPISRRAEPRLWRAWVVARVAVLLVVATFLAYAVHFNADGNKLREAYVKAGAQWVEWSQRANYLRHGFLAGVLFNTDTPAMKEPEGYSEAAMEEIAQRWSAAADQLNAERDPHALDDVNVVVILSESFSDPTKLQDVTLQRDPIPYTRKLLDRTTSGEMLTQFIGGGTANMEFEVLTGFSLSQFTPQMNTPYQQLIPNYASFPSAVEYMKAHGHVPVAIHPYHAIMYKRDRVYPIFGFDEFVDETKMQSLQGIERNNFPADKTSFDEVEYQIDKYADPVFVNLVTMQNHYPMAGKYDDPIEVGPSVGVVRPQLSAYATGLEYSDEAMKGFLADLKKSSEKTAVVFYGDHAPPFWPKSRVFRENEEQLRKTPFFLWTNFDKLPHSELPLTSPSHFLPLLFDRLGVPLSPWYALLDALYDEVPAMATGEYHTADGDVVNEPEKLSPEAQSLLDDYRMVQYDLTIGKRYVEDQMLDVPDVTLASP
jgi:phosphoglycerol transferase MdoB-like AlkP superfamily enzyme